MKYLATFDLKQKDGLFGKITFSIKARDKAGAEANAKKLVNRFTLEGKKLVKLVSVERQIDDVLIYHLPSETTR